jgi:hypothetical protein
MPRALCRALAPKVTTGTQAPISVGKWVTLRKYIVQRSCSHLMLNTLAPIDRLCVLNHSPCISDDPRVMCRALAPKVTTGTQAPIPVGNRRDHQEVYSATQLLSLDAKHPGDRPYIDCFLNHSPCTSDAVVVVVVVVALVVVGVIM